MRLMVLVGVLVAAMGCDSSSNGVSPVSDPTADASDRQNTDPRAIIGVWVTRRTNEAGRVLIGTVAYRQDGGALWQAVVSDGTRQIQFVEHGTWQLHPGGRLETTVTNSSNRQISEPLKYYDTVIAVTESNLICRTENGETRVFTRPVK